MIIAGVREPDPTVGLQEAGFSDRWPWQGIPPAWPKLGAIAVACLFGLAWSSPAAAAENDHGLVYSVWFAPPGPDDPEVPPLTAQDQVRYCGAAEEWSRRIWEVTDGSHLIYQVHFFSGYQDKPPSTIEVEWRRWKDTPNANDCSQCFHMFDTFKGCSKDYAFENGELKASLACTGAGEVCSSEDPADLREASCQIGGEPVPTPTADLGWVMAHENAHSHYNLSDEYIPTSSPQVYGGYGVCVGEAGNQGTDKTSMMAKRMRNHFCDGETHVSQRPVRNLAGEIVLDDEGQPTMVQNPNHPDGVWVDALATDWQKHPLEYSGSYDNVPAFPGLPIPHLDSGNPVQFCVWHFQGDGKPINDALVLLDKSGSMGFRHPAFDDGPTALEAASQSALSFYNSLRDDRLGGILAFDTEVAELVPYGPKADDAPSIDVSHGGNTDLCRAIREGGDAIKAKAPSADFGGGQQILLSDGRPTVEGCNTDAEVLQAAMDACNGGLEGVGVATNTVAFGDADRELLRQVADVCGAQTTALLVPTSAVEIEGQITQQSTPLQIRTALARSGRFARNHREVLHVDAPLAPIRDDVFVVPPGTSELAVEWMGDGFEHVFLSDQNVIDCRFANLDFRLVRPNGTVVTDSEAPVADELKELSRTIRLKTPEPGTWRARIEVGDKFICHPAFPGMHVWGDYDPRVAAVASVSVANISPQMKVSPTVAARDMPVKITASMVLSGSARITAITASAKVTHDSGTDYGVTLFDDATHGDETAGDGTYTGIFNEDRAALADGGYRVVVSLVSAARSATPVPAGDAGLEIAGGPLPSAPDAAFTVEDSFVYRDCVMGNGLAGSTCGDRFAIPSGPGPGNDCSIPLPPGSSRKGIMIETRGMPIGERGVVVSGGVGVRVRKVETVSYDAKTRRGLIRFDAEATSAAPDEPRHFRVSFAGQSISTRECRPPIRPRFEYAAKLVCGAQTDTRNMQLARGFYATTINVRNPHASATTFEKILSLTVPPGNQKPGRLMPLAIDTLGSQEALAVDCEDIRERAFGGKLPAPFIEGYVVLRSPRRLGVTGVYSTATLNAEGTAENHSSIHLEPATESQIRPGDALGLPDLTIQEIDMNTLQVDCPSGQGSCRTRVDVTVANIGGVNAGQSELRVTIDPNQSLGVTAAVPELAAGGTSRLKITFPPADNCFDPNCTVCAVADHEANLEESDETNNQMCRTRGG